METQKYLALVYVLGALLFAVIFLNYGGCSHSQQTFASDTTMVLDTDTDLKLGIDTASMPTTITPQENPHSVGNNTDVSGYIEHHLSEAYKEGYSRGYSIGEEDAIAGNGYLGQFDKSNDYSGKRKKDYEEGYNDGYEAGYDDNISY